jgi:uncharacterized repeat protein (TIGR01451 family)
MMFKKFVFCIFLCIIGLTSGACAENSHSLAVVSDTQTQWLSPDGSWKPVVLPSVQPLWERYIQFPEAQWVWPYTYLDTREKEGPFTFRRVFTLPDNAVNTRGTMTITVDDNLNSVKFNGKDLGLSSYEHFDKYVTTSLLPKAGENTLEFVGENNIAQSVGISATGNPAGAIYRIEITYDLAPATTAAPTAVPVKLNVVKSASPASVKTGQDITVKIDLENTGSTPLNDIEVSDAASSDFDFVSGDIQGRYLSLKPGESRTIQYTIRSKSTGKFDLGAASFRYADATGNYSSRQSNSPMIEVIAPLTSLTPAKSPGLTAVAALVSVVSVAVFFRKKPA